MVPCASPRGEPYGIVFAVVEGHTTDAPYPSPVSYGPFPGHVSWGSNVPDPARGMGTTEGTNTARSKAMEHRTDKLKEGIKDTAEAVKRGAEKVKDAAGRGVEKSKKAAVRTAEKVKDTTDRAVEKVRDA